MEKKHEVTSYDLFQGGQMQVFYEVVVVILVKFSLSQKKLISLQRILEIHI